MVILADKRLVVPRLSELGLTEEVLRDAVAAGELQRVSCSSSHPKLFPGVAAWAYAVERLALGLAPLGWRKREPQNVPMVIDPVRRIALVVSSGDASTGLRDRQPTNRHPKGDGFLTCVVEHQGLLFGEDREFAPTPHLGELSIWLLLVCAEQLPRSDGTGRHVARCELSLPAEMDGQGYVTNWTERIILEPVTMDDVPLSLEPPPDDDDGGIDVPVTRR